MCIRTVILNAFDLPTTSYHGGIGAPLAPVPLFPFVSVTTRSARHPLTRRRTPIIVISVSRMQKPIDIRHALAVSKQDVWVCLLLAILLLYNPFLVTLGSAASLTVQHAGSYRATVGSSEMQQFASAAGQDLFDFADSAPVQSFHMLPVLSGLNFFFSVPSKIGTAQKFLCASLWFRPPPAS